MNAVEFVGKWNKVDLSERSAAQQHFLDLCELVGHPKPAEAVFHDPDKLRPGVTSQSSTTAATQHLAEIASPCASAARMPTPLPGSSTALSFAF